MTERTVEGQLFYDYDIDSPTGHWLVTITAISGKLYAMFVTAKPADWERDQQLLRLIYRSFSTTAFAQKIERFGPESNNARYFGKSKDIGKDNF